MGKPFQEKRAGSCRCCKGILCENDCDPFEEKGCCEIQDEATIEGESGSGEKLYDAEDEAQGSPDMHDEIRRRIRTVRLGGRNRTTSESTLVSLGENSESCDDRVAS
ncbi:hypothetical protein Dimus_021010 [Dionaea muscipula]